MIKTTEGWHKRFVQQARWSQEIRDRLFLRARIHEARRILDVGCGTGALLTELTQRCQALVHGLDINSINLKYAMTSSVNICFTQGDATIMPYIEHIFDISLCHFLLLWIKNPETVVREMARVTKPEGVILALAEPDYGGRIDYPYELSSIWNKQRTSLQQQGADIEMGRKLAKIFISVGLSNVESGVLGGRWSKEFSMEDFETEWDIINSDLRDEIDKNTLNRLKRIDLAAWQKGERILFIPTFFAYGRVPY